jgi:hypothetical protein
MKELVARLTLSLKHLLQKQILIDKGVRLLEQEHVSQL